MNKNFDNEVASILYKIADDIEAHDETCEIDIDVTQDILNIETKNGIYVINKQRAAGEIWLSSPISGPYHFKKIDNMWIARDDSEIFTLLSQEFNFKITND